MGKDSFILYDEYSAHIELLSMEQRGVLLTAIFAYRNGEEPPEMDNAAAMLFSVIKAQFERDNEKYQATCVKRRAAGSMGGAPRGNQNAKKQPQNNPLAKKQAKQPKQANACNGANAGNISDCGGGQDGQKQPKQAKQPDNDNEHDNVHDIKEKSTYVLKKKRTETDGRTDEEIKREKAQADFFALYPEIGIDNYSAADYAEIDFELLARRFEESAFLRTRQSFSWICSNYRKIEAGEYKDFEKKKPSFPYPSPEKKNTLGAEWSDLDD